MKFVFTVLSLLFLPILSLKEIKPRRCINCKPFNEDDRFKKCSLLIKEQINDVSSLMNGFGKMYTEKYKKKCIFNKKEVEEEEEEVKEEDKEENNVTHYTFKI